MAKRNMNIIDIVNMVALHRGRGKDTHRTGRRCEDERCGVNGNMDMADVVKGGRNRGEGGCNREIVLVDENPIGYLQ